MAEVQVHCKERQAGAEVRCRPVLISDGEIGHSDPINGDLFS